MSAHEALTHRVLLQLLPWLHGQEASSKQGNKGER